MTSIIALLIYIGLCWLIAHNGRTTKFGFWGNFAASLIFTPLVGLIIRLAQDHNRPAKA